MDHWQLYVDFRRFFHSLQVNNGNKHISLLVLSNYLCFENVNTYFSSPAHLKLDQTKSFFFYFLNIINHVKTKSILRRTQSKQNINFCDYLSKIIVKKRQHQTCQTAHVNFIVCVYVFGRIAAIQSASLNQFILYTTLFQFFFLLLYRKI